MRYHQFELWYRQFEQNKIIQKEAVKNKMFYWSSCIKEWLKCININDRTLELIIIKSSLITVLDVDKLMKNKSKTLVEIDIKCFYINLNIHSKTIIKGKNRFYNIFWFVMLLLFRKCAVLSLPLNLISLVIPLILGLIYWCILYFLRLLWSRKLF